MKKIYLMLFAMLTFAMGIFAQTTVVLTPTNATNWTGSVVAAGTIATPTMTGVLTSSTIGARGFARFDLSTIPSGAVITAATMRITTATPTSSSTSTANAVTVTGTDPLVASGAALYTALGAGTVANTASWAGAAPATFNLSFSSGGISALTTLANGTPSAFVTIGLLRGSTNSYTITGSNGTSTTVPQLTITYTVPTSVPACATGLVPADAATGIAVTGAISWAATAEANSYDIYFGKTTNPAFVGNVAGTSATISAGFDLNTLYYWKIVPKNAIGDAIGCTEQTFTTGATPATTCVTGLYPSGNFGCVFGDAITNVTFVNINNNTTCTAFPYYTSYSTPIASPVPVGSGTSISITNGDPDDRAKVWIDLNDNGIFATDELFFNAKGANLSGSITLPLTAPLGNHKMRVRIVWMSDPTTQPEQNFTACSLQGYGEVEDYVINVTAAASCVNPTGLAASAVTTNSASLDWNAVSGADGYVYSFGTTNTPPADPSTATATTAITYAAASLAQLTTYYMHVATNCGGTYSSWSTTSFTTPIDCATAPVLTCGGTPTAAVFTAGAGVWNFAGTAPTNSCGAATAGIEKVYKFTPATTGAHAINVTTASTGGSVEFLIKESSAGCSATGFTCIGSSSSLTTGTGAITTPTLTAGIEYLIAADPNLAIGSTISFSIDCPTVLPVFIEFFKGSKQGTNNFLDWKVTCTNEPTITMSLERSADGRNFKSIQDQTATATRCLQSFNYVDATPLAGYNYYRLKTVTLDGKVKYSTIVVLLNKEKGFELISIVPNPVQNTAILSLTSVKGGKIELSVSDLAGKVISKQSKVVIAGNNPINMNFESLGAGTYIITAVNADGDIKTTRFVKL